MYLIINRFLILHSLASWDTTESQESLTVTYHISSPSIVPFKLLSFVLLSLFHCSLFWGLCCAPQVPIGTSWILIGNFWSQYRPNSSKFLQFFQLDSNWNQWNRSVLPVPSPINSDQYQVELIGTSRKEPHQCIYSRRSPDDILSRGK